MAKKLKTKLLTKRKAEWAKNRDVTLRGSKLSMNIGTEAAYNKRLQSLVTRMTKSLKREINKALVAHFNTAQDSSIISKVRMVINKLEREFNKEFRSRADRMSKNMLSSVNKDSTKALHNSLKDLSGGLSIKTSAVTEGVSDVLTAAVAQNVGLIKSIPSEYFTQVRTQILNSIMNPDNKGLSDLRDSINGVLSDRYKRVRNRAHQIATDQTRKAYNQINAAKMTSMGIEYFEWVHSGGGKTPRPYHRDVLNGKTFKISEPPIIDQNTGERGLPGQAINCRCTMIPSIPLG
jgi:SPP1 gp7 family putative phage head morphogenesis protein